MNANKRFYLGLLISTLTCAAVGLPAVAAQSDNDEEVRLVLQLTVDGLLAAAEAGRVEESVATNIKTLTDLKDKKGACVAFQTAAAGCVFQRPSCLPP